MHNYIIINVIEPKHQFKKHISSSVSKIQIGDKC